MSTDQCTLAAAALREAAGVTNCLDDSELLYQYAASIEAGAGDHRWVELADLLATLPARLRSARTNRGLSLRQAANQIGIAHSAVSKIENGGRCELASAVAIARWLAAAVLASGPSIHTAEAANAMANADGDRFYPDGREDAAHFAEHHAAAFVKGATR